MKAFTAKWPGVCYVCRERFPAGTEVTWPRGGEGFPRGLRRHVGCDRTITADEAWAFYNAQRSAHDERTGGGSEETQQKQGDTESSQPVGPVKGETMSETGNGGLGDALFGVIEGRVRDLIAEHGVNREALDAAIDRAMERYTAPIKRVEVVWPTGETRDLGVTHILFERVLKTVRRGHVYLYGGPGGGKSHLAMQVARALAGDNWAFMSLNAQSPAWRVEGYRAPDGTPVTVDVIRLAKTGGVLILDEVDAANGNLLASLNTMLENKWWAPPGAAEAFAVHERFRVIACGNTAGRGATRSFAGRNVLDGAFCERFAFVRFEYDERLESALVAAVNAGETGVRWLGWVRAVRHYLSEHASDAAVFASPRASIRGSEAIADGDSFTEAADVYLFKGCDPALRGRILEACPLPVE